MKAIPTAEQREFAASLRGAAVGGEPGESGACARMNPAPTEAPRRCGRHWPTPGCSGSPSPRSTAVRAARCDDLAVFYTEAGRALCPTTVHSSVQAALAIDQLGSPDVKAAWLPPLASGTVRGTTALWSARDAAVVSPVLQADSVSTAVAAQRNCGLCRRRRRRRPHRGFGRRTASTRWSSSSTPARPG